jgi:hypothetical protein
MENALNHYNEALPVERAVRLAAQLSRDFVQLAIAFWAPSSGRDLG